MTTEALADIDLDFAKLKSEQDEIMREQASGAWDKPFDGESQEAFELRVQQRIRRGIEVTSELRRTNTGPPKSKASAKRGKKVIDLEAINRELLE